MSFVVVYMNDAMLRRVESKPKALQARKSTSFEPQTAQPMPIGDLNERDSQPQTRYEDAAGPKGTEDECTRNETSESVFLNLITVPTAKCLEDDA